MIKNIIFDVGGVILDWDAEEMISHFTNDEEEKKFLYDNAYKCPEWSLNGLIDTGFVSQEEFAEIVKDRTNHVNDTLIEKFIFEYYKYLVIDDRVIDLMKKLKEKGYKIYVLSNMNDYVVQRIEANKYLDLTDGYVISYQVHQIKPFVAIYKTLLDRYNINPNESVFIDDVKDNIDTAEQLGIKGCLVRRNVYEDIIEGLKNYNILD